MYTLDKLPHLHATRLKASYPFDRLDPTRFNLVFIAQPTLESGQKFLKELSPYINRNIDRYTLDRIYRGKAFNKMYYESLIAYKVDPFQTRDGKNVRYERMFNTLRNKNVFVDLGMYHQLFFNLLPEAATVDNKTIQYLDVLKSAVTQDQYRPYRTKVIIFDVRQWVDTNDIRLNISELNNPIMFIRRAMYRHLDSFKEFDDLHFIITDGAFTIRVTPKECDDSSYSKFNTEFRKLNTVLSSKDEREIEADDTFNRAVLQSFTDNGMRRLTGDSPVSNVVDDAILKKASEIKKESEDLTDEEVATAVAESDPDEELMSEIARELDTAVLGKQKSAASSKRDELLREEQKKVRFKDMKLGEIVKYAAERQNMSEIETLDVSDKVSSTNDNVKKIKFSNFEKSYNANLMEQDIANTILQLNKASIPVYVRDIKTEDTSNELSLKETMTVTLEDENRVRHTLKFDVPKFIDDKFMHLNGNKKLIVKQLMSLPIVKTGPNTVWIVSNYNKMQIKRVGHNVSSKITKMTKALATNDPSVKIKPGNQLIANKDVMTTIEYDEFARLYETIDIPGKAKFFFNVPRIEEEMKKLNLPKQVSKEEGETLIPIAIVKSSPKATVLYVSSKSQMIQNGVKNEDIVSTILSFSPKLKSVYDEQKAGKKFIYTSVKMLEKQVPILMLLGYTHGLQTVIRKAGVNHYFSETRPRVSEDQGVVQFEDGYLVFDKYPFENSLLMNALYSMPTRAYTYDAFNEKDVYVELFDVMFNQRNLAAGIDNFKDFLIDPITLSVLEDLNLPTEFADVIIYAQKLLLDNEYTPETDLSLYRVRSNEIVSVYLYKAIAAAYRRYYNSSGSNNPTKISVPQDCITKSVLTAQTIEDYSILNPIVELEKSHAISPKGPGGMNLARGFTLEKRAYSESMVGTIAMSTSPDANVGVVRALTTEPSVVSARGYLESNNGDFDQFKDVNLFSPGELLSPLGASRDDTVRTAMAIKQSKHVIPVKNSSPVLISNGLEQTIPYQLSTDYSIVAKEDGEVVEINNDAKFMIVKYKSGEHQAIDISDRVVKNGSGGFYLVNKMEPHFKLNQKFKKNDIIATDDSFFSNDEDGIRFNIGTLEKLAIMSSYSTYEDSTLITHKLADDVATKVTIPREVTLGPNANVDYMVKIGDEVSVGDELIRFENSFDEESVNKFLASVGEDLGEEIRTLGKHPVRSHYTGRIVDIKVISTVDLDELSPSLRKIVSDSYARTKKRKYVLNKYDKSKSFYKMGVYITDPEDKVVTKDGKVKGNIVNEGVLIQIFVEYEDVAGIGDKITFFTALKSIVGEVIPKGYEPYSVNAPDEEISSFIAPGAVLARMTPSIMLTMFGNKVLVELKKSLEEIYNS